MTQNQNVPRPRRDMFPEGVAGDRLYRYMLELVAELGGETPGEEDLSIIKATDSGSDTYISSGIGGGVPADKAVIRRDFQSANTTATPTLDGKTITDPGGNAIWSTAINGVHELKYVSGTDTYLLLNPYPSSDNKDRSYVRRDLNGRAKFADPSAAQDAATKKYADDQDATFEQQRCQVWVCFDGTGTVSVKDSYNVSSVQDNGTGDYTILFDTDLADTNYAVAGVADDNNNSGGIHLHESNSRFVGNVRINTWGVSDDASSGGLSDPSLVSVIIFGGN